MLKRWKDVKLTNIGSPDHTDVISPNPNTTYTLLGRFSGETNDICHLGRSTLVCDYGELGSDFD